MAINITFRTHLLGSIMEFCEATRLSTLQSPIVLVDLIVRLAKYQEEGNRLFPKVYITNNIKKVMTMLPDSELLKIGEAQKGSVGIKRAIKKCAPLAHHDWMIYILEQNERIEYGVFKGSSNPTSVLVDDVLMGPDTDLKVAKVFQLADDCVEVKSNSGNLHYVFLSHRKEEDPPPMQDIEGLVKSVTKNVKTKHKEAVISYLMRVLHESLVKSHGCIIAVTNMDRIPKALAKDGVFLDNPIDFNQLVEKFKRSEISQSYIESKSYLLGGMLNSDGIVLFDNRARILGFNIFVPTQADTKVDGGARRRAFETLKKQVSRGLSAVFMQSHDGWTEFEGGNK